MTRRGWVALGDPRIETGAGVGQLAGPTSVVVGADDRIYIADYLNSRIVRVDDMDGNGWIALGDGSGGSQTGQLDQPVNVVLG
jgi:hypothetical protein